MMKRIVRALLCKRGLHLMRHRVIDDDLCTVSCEWCGWSWRIEGSLAGFQSRLAERHASGEFD